MNDVSPLVSTVKLPDNKHGGSGMKKLIASAWEAQQISFESYKDGALVHSYSSYAVNTTDPLWIGLNWSGIDSLVISSTGDQWIMDDFTSSVVPIPAAVYLFASGLGLLGWFRRKA